MGGVGWGMSLATLECQRATDTTGFLESKFRGKKKKKSEKKIICVCHQNMSGQTFHEKHSHYIISSCEPAGTRFLFHTLEPLRNDNRKKKKSAAAVSLQNSSHGY